MEQQLKQKLNINDTTSVVCEKCQNNTFQEVVFLRKVSALMTGNGKPAFIPIPSMICSKCQAPVDEMIPDELKTSIVV